MTFNSVKKRILFWILLSLVVLMILSNLLGNFISSLFWRILLNLLLIGAYLKVVEVVFTRRVLEPIYLINKVAEEVAENNLSNEVQITSGDEFTVLGQNINQMLANLRRILQENLEAAEKLMLAAHDMSAMAEEANLSSQEVTSAIDVIAKGTEEQSQHVKQSSLAAQQMASTAQEVAAESQKAASFSTKASERAKAGGEIIQTVREKILQVKETVDSSADTVRRLGLRSQEIGKITDVIRGISRQTNLLALNAAIEAARAGEHGRGFSVVADEVRALAEQTTQSTGQIVEMIAEIQKETQSAVEAMESGKMVVDEGAALANQANEAFIAIVNSVTETVQTIQEIAAASQEQAASSEEMTSTMAGVEEIAQRNVGAAQQVAAVTEQQRTVMEQLAKSSSDLVEMAEHLTSMVGRFRVSANFQRCWRVMDCNWVDCPAYQAKEEKCWLIPNTLCRNGIPSGSVLEKRAQCHQCKVFKINTVVSGEEEEQGEEASV
ncbi:MAG: methyl-accepting chemotaxis protein [Firmicutes bacterium]|nr:methyl-accepting chemotaxis protein [Bacillota bacterium]